MKDALSHLAEQIAAKLNLSNASRQARGLLAQREVNAPLLSFIRSRPWAITAQGLKGLASHANSKLDYSLEDFFELRPETAIKDGTAVVHVHGALVDSCPAIYEKLGMVTRYSTIIADIADVTAQGAKQIVLVINSPGGTVAGIKEAADAIAASRIPITSYCAGLACSAAYHLAAGTKRITASPSATVGNIGTIMSWADDSEFWSAIGIEWKALFNEGADLKSTGHLEPNDTQLAFLQEQINESGKAFGDHVRKHRPGIDKEVFRAGWYSGEKAKSLGLVDAIGRLDSVISGASSGLTAKATALPSTLASALAAAPSKPIQTSHTTPATMALTKSTAFAKADISTLLQVHSGSVASDPRDLPAIGQELESRGFIIEGGKAFYPRSLFEKLTPHEKGSMMAAGGKLTDREPPKTPSQISAEREMTFPTQPNSTRTAAEFMAFSDAQVRSLVSDMEKREGKELRQEFYDANASLAANSWRHYEVKDNGGFKSLSDYRQAFYQKFKLAFPALQRWGSLSETPNDPAPPVSPNAMTARQWLELDTGAAKHLSDLMRMQVLGRNSRAELKRAYRAGSPAEKEALMANFGYSLGLFPAEPV